MSEHIRDLSDAIARVTPCSCSAQRARAERAEAKVARVEALAEPGFIPGPAILCASPQDRDDQWRKALRAALSDGGDQ